jgi:ornithine cyclodeaminase/alanine dehydrogenase-like protein (mu-crystallin family)
VLILSNDDLAGLLSPLQLIAVVESAVRAEDKNHLIMPMRSHVDWGNNSLFTMPVVGATNFGVKIVLVTPASAFRGLPVTNGVMILSDRETGVPLALLNAAALTAQRTGAIGGLGVRYLTPKATSSIGVVGCGVQGTWQAIFACAERPVKEVFSYCRSMAGFEKFAVTVCRHTAGVRITPCKSAREVVERTQLVITATTSVEPVLPDESRLLDNKHFISIGSYKPTMQELPDSVYRLAGRLAVDSEHACQEVGDVINPLRRGILKETDVFSIAECVMGKRTRDTARTTAFKSVGAAIYDLFVAQEFYLAAKSRGVGCEIAL